MPAGTTFGGVVVLPTHRGGSEPYSRHYERDHPRLGDNADEVCGVRVLSSPMCARRAGWRLKWQAGTAGALAMAHLLTATTR
ncbi:MAG: hypothetical protein M3336_09830 [Chloroflexota bacterium]|nr:hypothetical protein [Chloroflexota bacterium]